GVCGAGGQGRRVVLAVVGGRHAGADAGAVVAGRDGAERAAAAGQDGRLGGAALERGGVGRLGRGPI
ncbi:hypothetical protein LPJ70_006552, partial [Coemansia sp. RSA 2708]